jgi:hypothetical protein
MTLALAIIGAVTGLAALLAQVWQFTASGPRVKVTASNALTTTDLQWHLSIDLSNVGRLPATINDVGVLVESGGKVQKMPMVGLGAANWSGPPLPLRLIDGEAATYLLSAVVVAQGLASEHARRDVRVYAKLATNQQIPSRNRIDVVNLAQL